MARSKRSIVTVLSILYLIALTVVACYAHYMVHRLSLPIPTALSGLTIILPAVHGLVLERLTRLSDNPKHNLAVATRARRSSTASSSYASSSTRRRGLRHGGGGGGGGATLTSLALVALTVTATALATLAGTRLAPAAGLSCGLEDAWRALYRRGAEPEVRRIQDAFGCCGLRSVYDMAWPFAKHDDKTGRTVRSTCARTYGRSTPCFGAWREEEQVVAGLIVVVCAGVWVWEMIVVYMPSRRPSWWSRVREVNKPGNHANGNGNGNGDARHAIEYHDAENGSVGYRDTPIVRVEDADADAEDETGDSPRSRQGSVQRAIEARLGIDGEHDEHHTLIASSPAAQEENEWRRS